MANEQFTQPAVPGLPGFVRLSGDPDQLVNSLGPLASLLGTWMSNRGWNLIAVPSGTKSFQLLVRPYIETVTFTPIGAPVPNRGGVETLFVEGVLYELRITDAETNQPLHLENGMWLLLANDPDGGPTIARQATVPHGDSVLALGNYTIAAGPPQIPDISSLPDTGKGAPLGYTDPYLTNLPGFNKTNPNANLQAIGQEQNIVQTVTMDVSTQNEGGITNIPFLVKHANASSFQGTFWIETVEPQYGGAQYQQLQYSQQTNIDFLPRFDDKTKLISWPHININTLVKQ